MVKTSGDQCNIRPDVFIMYMFYGRKLPGSCNVRIQKKIELRFRYILEIRGVWRGGLDKCKNGFWE